MSGATEKTLETLGLAVTEHSLSSGETVYKVSGDTYPYRRVLREIGGRWNSMDEVWVFSGGNPSEAVVDGVQVNRQAQGLSDAMPTNPVLSNKPHYLGHRGRLRDRFLSGSAESIPDYELLELLLFYSIDQRDTKPLSKELLGRFESLAGVLNADRAQLEEFEHINKAHPRSVQSSESDRGADGEGRAFRSCRSGQLGQADRLSSSVYGPSYGRAVPRSFPQSDERPDKG